MIKNLKQKLASVSKINFKKLYKLYKDKKKSYKNYLKFLAIFLTHKKIN